MYRKISGSPWLLGYAIIFDLEIEIIMRASAGNAAQIPGMQISNCEFARHIYGQR